MTPFVADSDFQLWNGDCIDVLRQMPAGSVHCCVTSPPYWGLRDYGAEGQIGLEDTPDEYVARMVDVFREVRRVLRDDGTLWLNLGDSYAGGGGFSPNAPSNLAGSKQTTQGGAKEGGIKPQGYIKAKDLVGIPWRVALALQQPWLRCPTCNIEAHAAQWRDVGEWLMCPNLCENEALDVPVSEQGWYLRSDIIWSKPNPMPESVTDRPTKAHEYVFLLTKSSRYYFDAEAVREKSVGPDRGPGMTRGVNGPHAEQAGLDSRARRTTATPARRTALIPEQTKAGVGTQGVGSDTFGHWPEDGGRNVRSVWEITTQPYAEAHFATFPQELPRRCIKAGSPAGGVILDPFMGSGTTAYVARALGRRSIGIELNPEYAALCAKRMQQLSLLAD